jgi:NAD(P)-dependent dehydrogenase (short-subunit alcohol dehydrogenase family)
MALLTRSIAVDHGPDGIRVNCPCPGLMDTETSDWIRHDEEALAGWSSRILARAVPRGGPG